MNYREVAKASTADRPIFSLIAAAHALEAKLESALNRAGLSTPKFSVLTQLVSEGTPMSLGELASRLSCVRSNMTQLVDRLEAEGLARRVDDPEDRRGVKAEITALGRQRQAAGADEVAKLDAEFAANSAIEDRVAFERLLLTLK